MTPSYQRVQEAVRRRDEGSATEERGSFYRDRRRQTHRPLDRPRTQEPTNPTPGRDPGTPLMPHCARIHSRFRKSVSHNFGANFWWRVVQNRGAERGGVTVTSSRPYWLVSSFFPPSSSHAHNSPGAVGAFIMRPVENDLPDGSVGISFQFPHFRHLVHRGIRLSRALNVER